MSLAIKTVECNGGCTYCYEKNIRENNKYPPVDIDKIMETLKQLIGNYKQVTIHGGEPLLLGKKNIERLFKFIHERKGQTGIQTNGILIDDDYLELFKKYNTHVGFSIDGDDYEANSLRWNKKDVENNTEGVLYILSTCKTNKIRTSVIAMVHKKSVGKMIDFVKLLFENYDITSCRVNPCVFYGKDKSNEIENDELFKLYKELSKLKYDIRPIADIKNLLLGRGESTCTFSECDPFLTTAEVPILGDGSLGNCLHGVDQNGMNIRTNKKSDIRYRMLEAIPMQNGGCKNCDYWTLCRAGCPAAGANDDWRNKTRFCEAYKEFFRFMYLEYAGEILRSRTDNKKGNYHNQRHGDIPHGDHTDRALLRCKK